MLLLRVIWNQSVKVTQQPACAWRSYSHRRLKCCYLQTDSYWVSCLRYLFLLLVLSWLIIIYNFNNIFYWKIILQANTVYQSWKLTGSMTVYLCTSSNCREKIKMQNKYSKLLFFIDEEMLGFFFLLTN